MRFYAGADHGPTTLDNVALPPLLTELQADGISSDRHYSRLEQLHETATRWIYLCRILQNPEVDSNE